MAITFIKSKPAKAAAPAAAKKPTDLSEWATKIDEAGAKVAEAESIDLIVAKALLPYKDRIEKARQLRKEAADIVGEIVPFVREAHEADEDDKKSEELGETHKLDVGKKGNSRRITDLAMAKKYLGTDTFMKIATVTLKNLDDYLTKAQRDQVVTTDKTDRPVILAKRVVT